MMLWRQKTRNGVRKWDVCLDGDACVFFFFGGGAASEWVFGMFRDAFVGVVVDFGVVLVVLCWCLYLFAKMFKGVAVVSAVVVDLNGSRVDLQETY